MVVQNAFAYYSPGHRSFARAEQFFRDALALSVKVYGTSHELTCTCKGDLATVLLHRRHYEEVSLLVVGAFSSLRSSRMLWHLYTTSCQAMEEAKEAITWFSELWGPVCSCTLSFHSSSSSPLHANLVCPGSCTYSLHGVHPWSDSYEAGSPVQAALFHLSHDLCDACSLAGHLCGCVPVLMAIRCLLLAGLA